MPTLKPFIVPKAEDENKNVNEIIKTLDSFVRDLTRVIDEYNKQIDDLDDRITALEP